MAFGTLLRGETLTHVPIARDASQVQLRPPRESEALAFAVAGKHLRSGWDAPLDILGTTAREVVERVPTAGTELNGRPPEIEFYFHLEVSESLDAPPDGIGILGSEWEADSGVSWLDLRRGDHLPFKESFRPS